MKIWIYSRGAFAALLIATTLTACSQANVSGTPFSAAGAAQSQRERQATSYGNLLYIAAGSADVAFFSYPGMQPVGQLFLPGGLCPDQSGNVYVVYNSIYEFAHGGTTSIKKLSASGGSFTRGCSVDSVTGNLAAVFEANGSHGIYDEVAVFPDAQGTATFYTLPNMRSAHSVGYDGSGNLFVDGSTRGGHFRFAELLKGGTAFESISLNLKNAQPEQVQWDGSYITLVAGAAHKLYRLQVNGTEATIVGTTVLNDSGKDLQASWIYGDTIIASFRPRSSSHDNVGFWAYPAGGAPTKTFEPSSYFTYAITISPGS